MKITDIKAHVLDSETPALVTSFDGLFHSSGAAGTIKYTLVRVLTDTEWRATTSSGRRWRQGGHRRWQRYCGR